MFLLEAVKSNFSKSLYVSSALSGSTCGLVKQISIIGETLGKTVKEIRNAKKEIRDIKKSETKKEVA